MSDRQYALVHNGGIVNDRNGPVISGYSGVPPGDYSSLHPPGCAWLPIENVDSQPFDIRTCRRGTPTYEVRGDHVCRVYPVSILRQA